MDDVEGEIRQQEQHRDIEKLPVMPPNYHGGDIDQLGCTARLQEFGREHPCEDA